MLIYGHIYDDDLCILFGSRSCQKKMSGVIWIQTDTVMHENRIFFSLRYLLRAISGIVHAHHSCGGKRGKLSGSRLSTIFQFASIQVSDTLTSGGYFLIFWTKK